jgi:hypothetical protein
MALFVLVVQGVLPGLAHGWYPKRPKMAFYETLLIGFGFQGCYKIICRLKLLWFGRLGVGAG